MKQLDGVDVRRGRRGRPRRARRDARHDRDARPRSGGALARATTRPRSPTPCASSCRSPSCRRAAPRSSARAGRPSSRRWRRCSGRRWRGDGAGRAAAALPGRVRARERSRHADVVGPAGLAAAVDRLRPSLRAFRDERGRELLDLPDAPIATGDEPAPPRFLPWFDNILLGHDDRSRVLPYGHRLGVVGGSAFVLVDGFARATWRIERAGDAATLHVQPLEPLESAGDRRGGASAAGVRGPRRRAPRGSARTSARSASGPATARSAERAGEAAGSWSSSGTPRGGWAARRRAGHPPDPGGDVDAHGGDGHPQRLGQRAGRDGGAGRQLRRVPRLRARLGIGTPRRRATTGARCGHGGSSTGSTPPAPPPAEERCLAACARMLDLAHERAGAHLLRARRARSAQRLGRLAGWPASSRPTPSAPGPPRERDAVPRPEQLHGTCHPGSPATSPGARPPVALSTAARARGPRTWGGRQCLQRGSRRGASRLRAGQIALAARLGSRSGPRARRRPLIADVEAPADRAGRGAMVRGAHVP